MPSRWIADPFDRTPVEEIPLARNPLAFVVAQIQLPRPYTPLATAIENGSLASALSEEYPYAEEQEEIQFVFEPGRLPQSKNTSTKLLSMHDETDGWVVNIKHDSIALSTTEYISRTELLARATRIFDAVQNTVNTPRVSRVGLRYINRITDLTDVSTLAAGFNEIIRPTQGFALDNLDGMSHFQDKLLYAWKDTAMKLQAWWGTVPAGQPVAGILSPHEGATWILDIDALDETAAEFNAKTLTETMTTLSEQAYRFFRWIFTPEGLQQFGTPQ